MTHSGQAPRIVVIGAGFGGIGLGARLLREGITSFTILERADDVGGVWRDNTYPGAACDVPSHLYSYSWKLKPDWSRRFAEQEEIYAYLREAAAESGVLPHVRLGTAVTAVERDDAAQVWRVRTSTGEVLEAEVVVSAVGQLNEPAYPPTPGIERFRGTSFHSARWDHAHDLTGERVAVVGTGASAIQFVPEIAPVAARTTVFQRSAPYVIPKPDRVYSRREQMLYRQHPALLRASRAVTYLENEARTIPFSYATWLMKVFELRWRLHLRREVQDPALRALLTPDYTIGCKRILISDHWYRTLVRPDVHVVGAGVREVREHSVVDTEGTEHEVDTIIYGTGFRSTDFLSTVEVTGTGGRRLAEVWREGAEAYLGITVAGFPNLFLLYGPNTNLGHNSIIYMIENQVEYVVGCVRALQREGLAALDVRADVQEQFVRHVQERMQDTVWEAGCTSWYKNATGRNTNNWPVSTLVYAARTRAPDLRDYVALPQRAPAEAVLDPSVSA